MSDSSLNFLLIEFLPKCISSEDHCLCEGRGPRSGSLFYEGNHGCEQRHSEEDISFF